MRPNLGCGGFLHHPTNGLRQSLFELIQRDGTQVRSVGQETFDDSLNDQGWIRVAGIVIHGGLRGGIDANKGFTDSGGGGTVAGLDFVFLGRIGAIQGPKGRMQIHRSFWNVELVCPLGDRYILERSIVHSQFA